MYKFIVPETRETYRILERLYGHPESSDLKCNPDGWVLTKEQISDLEVNGITKYNIPDRYQHNIEEFKTDYWDGEIIFPDFNYFDELD